MSAAQNPFAPETRENPAGFRTREITIRTERAGEGVDAPLRIAISSEAPVERWSWDPELRESGGYYDEVLDHGPDGPDLSYVRDGIPFCVDHDIRKQVGIGTLPSRDSDLMLRTDLQQGAHPDAKWVFPDMETGVRKKVSIGYWPGTNYSQSKDEQTGRITRRYKGWILYEVSSVAVPADYAVGVGRSAGSVTPNSQAERETPAHSTEVMMAEKTESERGAPPAPDTRAAELAKLATDFPEHSRLAEWISGTTSVDAARDEIMRKMQADAKERAPVNPSNPAVTQQHDRAEDKPWKDDGGVEFIQSVVRAGRGGTVDVRLRASRAQNTQVGEDGGFAVPQAVSNILLEASITGGELLSRVTERPVTVGNTYSETLTLEESRANGSRNGGVRGYWITEDLEIPETQAKTRQHEEKLAKVGALAKLTDEQIEDGPAMLSFLKEQVPEELRFMQEAAIWEGSGAGQPLGAMNSGAIATVAIESAQTILNTAGNLWVNAAKMYSRMPTRLLGGAAWFINQELWAKILTSTAGTSGGSHPMFTPPGQLSALPNGGIYGKPVVPIEYASAEGTVGDFVFANFSDYLVIRKGGLKQATSMHVDFIRERQALRFSLRMNGKPRTRTPFAPYKGAATLSPYVVLAGRS